jgi:hypothetical protein
MAPPQDRVFIRSIVAPFLTPSELASGAVLSTPAGTAFVGSDDSYEAIGQTISNTFGANLTGPQWAVLTQSLNNDLTANTFGFSEVDGETRFEPAILGLKPTTGANTYTRTYTKAEPSAGGTVSFKILAGATIAGITIASPRLGQSVALSKVVARGFNYQYQQAVPDVAGYKTVTIMPADYDVWTSFAGLPKTATIQTGIQALSAAP